MRTLQLIFACKRPKFVDTGGGKSKTVKFCGRPLWMDPKRSLLRIFGCLLTRESTHSFTQSKYINLLSRVKYQCTKSLISPLIEDQIYCRWSLQFIIVPPQLSSLLNYANIISHNINLKVPTILRMVAGLLLQLGQSYGINNQTV